MQINSDKVKQDRKMHDNKVELMKTNKVLLMDPFVFAMITHPPSAPDYTTASPFHR